MTWNYRVIRSIEDGSLTLHEVYHMPDSTTSWTEDPIAPSGESLEELRSDLDRMLHALSQPIMREVRDGDSLRLEEEGP